MIVAASASHLHEGIAGISKPRNRQPELHLHNGSRIFELKEFAINIHEVVQCHNTEFCDHNGRLQLEWISNPGPVGLLEQPHPTLEWINHRLGTLRFAALSISEWQGTEHCFDSIQRNTSLLRCAMRSGEHMNSSPVSTLWDFRARLHREKSLNTDIDDEKWIWSLNKNLPPERPPLLVNGMLLDMTGPIARHVCKGWVFLSVRANQPGDFETVAISPEPADEL